MAKNFSSLNRSFEYSQDAAMDAFNEGACTPTFCPYCRGEELEGKSEDDARCPTCGSDAEGNIPEAAEDEADA